MNAGYGGLHEKRIDQALININLCDGEINKILLIRAVK